MTAADLDRAVRLTGANPKSATMRACRLALLEGVAPYAAARQAGVSAPGVYKALGKLRAALARPVCPTCGQPTDGRN